MCRITRGIDAATSAAFTSMGVGGRCKNFKVGAALYNGSVLMSAKANSYKTHPKLLPFTNYPHLHAEQAVILSVGFNQCHGTTLFVSRVLKDGNIAMAKPCEVCQELIRYAGVRRVFYTTENSIEQWTP